MSTDLRKRPVLVPAPCNGIGKPLTAAVQDTTHQMPTASVFPVKRFYALIVLFSLLLVAIEVILRWSIQNQGLGPSLSTYYYLWKFGPVCAFATASGFWNQAADCVKEARPRSKYTRGQTAFVTVGRILVALSTALSFQLLESQCVKRGKMPINLMAHAEFSGAKYNGDDVDANPALTVAGVYGLGQPWPPGTTDTYTFQPFSAAVQSEEVGGLMAGVVDLFTPSLHCEVASVVKTVSECSSVDCVKQQLSVALRTSACPEYRIALPEKSSNIEDEYYADVASASCTYATNKERDSRLIFIAAHWEGNNTPSLSPIACTPDYAMSQAYAVLHRGNGSAHMIIPIEITNQDSEHHISDVTPTDLAAGFIATLRDAAMPPSMLVRDRHSNHKVVHYTAFHHIANISFPHVPEDLLDASALEGISRRIFTSICAQIARQYLLYETSKEFYGDGFSSINRVMARQPIARTIEAMLLALILLSAAVLCRRPDPELPSGQKTDDNKPAAGLEQSAQRK